MNVECDFSYFNCILFLTVIFQYLPFEMDNFFTYTKKFSSIQHDNSCPSKIF